MRTWVQIPRILVKPDTEACVYNLQWNGRRKQEKNPWTFKRQLTWLHSSIQKEALNTVEGEDGDPRSSSDLYTLPVTRPSAGAHTHTHTSTLLINSFEHSPWLLGTVLRAWHAFNQFNQHTPRESFPFQYFVFCVKLCKASSVELCPPRQRGAGCCLLPAAYNVSIRRLEMCTYGLSPLRKQCSSWA